MAASSCKQPGIQCDELPGLGAALEDIMGPWDNHGTLMVYEASPCSIEWFLWKQEPFCTIQFEEFLVCVWFKLKSNLVFA